MLSTIGATEATPRRPWGVRAAALIALAFLLAPVCALALRAPWLEFPQVIAQPETRDMFILSLAAAAQSTVLAVILGVPLALWLHSNPPAAQWIRRFIIIPLAMPPVVAGIALGTAWGRYGIAAPILDALGLHLAFSFSGVVLSHTFVCLPFVVVTVDAALSQLHPEIEVSARSLGVSELRILTRIILPTVAAPICRGAGLAFVRSLGEFGATLTFAGSLPGVTRTVPLGVYLEREASPERAVVLSILLIAVACLVLWAAALPEKRRTSTTHSRRGDDDASIPQPLPAARSLDIARLIELTSPSTTPIAIRCSAGRTSTTHTAGVAAGTAPSDGSQPSAITFPSSSTTAVVGENGAGKSTLMGIFAGRLRADELTVEALVDGQAPHDLTDLPMQRRGIVMLTQRHGLPPHMTVRKAIALVATQRGNPVPVHKPAAQSTPGASTANATANVVAAPTAATVDALLDAAGLSDYADYRVDQLSGGLAAQVALVRALATRPAVLILDEPFAAVDVAAATRWREFFAESSTRRTTIMVTHHAGDVCRCAHHVVVMSNSTVIAHETPDRVVSQPPTDHVAQMLAYRC